jgi:excinuclease ABC subunit C
MIRIRLREPEAVQIQQQALMRINPRHPDADAAAPGSADTGSSLAGIRPDEVGTLPSLPGVYIMHDATGRVIYIGKAVNLQGRVSSYFTKSGDIRFNVRFLMRHVERIETIITANEKEAFLLENTLIKKHQPRYNIRLRDDKTYVSVCINVDHEWPRALVMRRRGGKQPGSRDKSIYLGPYASAGAVRDTLRQLQRIFPIRSCPDHVLKNRSRPCLLHSIGRCCAPCVKAVDRLDYGEMVEGTGLFLKGRTREVVRLLENQMSRCSEKLEYEQAAVIRDRLLAIRQTTEHQGVHRHDDREYDVIVIDRDGGYAAFVVFVYRNGLLVRSRPYVLKDHGRLDEDLMEEFLSRYYEVENPPLEILVDPSPRGVEFMELWLAEKREGRCRVHQPQRGEKLKLIRIVRENAARLLEQQLGGREAVEDMLKEIADKLHISSPPSVIECYDISTIQGFATVGSMVTFLDGEPDKSRYRRFRIKSLEGQDDFGSLREVLGRRFRKVVEKKDSAPDLVVIDGGKGQLLIAVDILQQLNLSSIPVVGMAKARIRKRGEETEQTDERFFLPGRKNPVKFRKNSPALYLLMRLRDEAHRFGITYHRELRKRKTLRSTLEDIPGVAKTRAANLLKHFGSMKSLGEATAEEIAEVKGMTWDLASRIHEHLDDGKPEESMISNPREDPRC